MKKFFALSFCLLICLTGCKDFTKKNQNFKVDKKKLIDESNHRGLTNLETLGMSLDSTTEDQASDILTSRKYVFVTLSVPNFMKDLIYDKELKSIFFDELQEDIKDKLEKSSIILVADSRLFQKENDKSKKRNFMFFIFDENKKLIMFFKKYSEYKEADLVIYEGIRGSYLSRLARLIGDSRTLVCRRDLSMAIIGTKDLEATPYAVLSPSIAKKHVVALLKSFASVYKSKEYNELLKEEELVKNSGNIRESSQKLTIFRESKEYMELEKRLETKVRNEYLKNLNKSSE